jgi:AbrB family looped-hinge helix DNA binding protein
MAQATLSSKNQIVIPKEAREKLGLKAGDKLIVTVLGGKVIVIERPKSYADALRGFAPGLYGPDYLKKERESWR